MQDFVHGSIWWKCDFHNHTPASNDYGNAVTKREDMTPRDWILSYMKAEIDCVGITDHNTGDWIDKLKEEILKLEEEGHADYRKIYLYPGVEISVSGGIHVLALFDPSKQARDIAHLIGAVRFRADAQGSSDAVTTASIEEVITTIIDAGGIAVPAHVDKRSGMFHVLGNKITAEQILSLNKLLAIEVVDENYQMPEVYNRKGLALANIAGSDSHSPDSVGKIYTWVKMRQPTIEALKLALHDGTDGIIRYQANETNPNIIEDRFFLTSLRITNGAKAGNGTFLNINFSPWMTSIIGGRGSGKSSLFNYLRLPFNKSDDIPDTIKPDFERFITMGAKGHNGMLRANTIIEAEFHKDKRFLKLEYNAQTQKRRLLERNKEGYWEISNDDLDPSKHFPINIFSQKQLYELAKKPNHILKMIDDRFDKTTWDIQLFKLEADWLDLRKKERDLTVDIKYGADLKEKVSALNARLESYESTEKELLTEFKSFNKNNGLIQNGIEALNHLVDELDPITQAANSFDLLSDEIIIPEGKLVEFEQIEVKLKEELLNLVELYGRLEALRISAIPSLKATAWYKDYSAVQDKYKALVQQLETSGQATNIDYDESLKEKKILDDKILAISLKRRELAENKASQIKLRDDIYSHHKSLRSKRKTSIEKWSSMSAQNIINIHLEELRDYSSEESFRRLIGKPGNEFANEILQKNDDEPTSGVIYDIINMKEVSDRWEMLNKRIDELVQATEEVPNNLGVRFIRHKENYKSQASEMLDRLLIWVPDDKIILKLVRDGREEDIETGSAGQKTAGMLSLLLTLDDNPLLIDQPEDDLDTRLISELLVKNFKLLKKNRQIIVITHNPNIAVNGSSEKIVQMEFKNGQIIKLESGSLQDKGVRGAVCEIMEGGKDALDKRYYRISQALETV